MSIELNDPRLLFREDVLADPRPLYDQLRTEAPVWQIPGQDSFLVSDPALIREVVARPSEFSSNLVSLLYRDETGGPAALDMIPLGDPTHVLAVADPPAHTVHRKLLQPHLSPEAVHALEGSIMRFTDEALDTLLAARRGDLVAGLTNTLPAQVVCTLIGFPVVDSDRIVQQVWDIGLLLDGVTDGDGMGKAASAALELTEYVQTHLDAAIKGGSGTPGLLGVLVRALEDQLINADNALGILMQIIVAGTETTSSLMATTIEAMARDEELQDRLRREPREIPNVIEKILRDDGPFQFHYRYTSADTVLSDVSIPANSRVLLMWAAANRPDVDQPDGVNRVQPDSLRSPHFAFGRGLHFCIGAPLARLEARVVIGRLLERTSRFTLDEAMPPVRRPSISLRRLVSLPLCFIPG